MQSLDECPPDSGLFLFGDEVGDTSGSEYLYGLVAEPGWTLDVGLMLQNELLLTVLTVCL